MSKPLSQETRKSYLYRIREVWQWAARWGNGKGVTIGQFLEASGHSTVLVSYQEYNRLNLWIYYGAVAELCQEQASGIKYPNSTKTTELRLPNPSFSHRLRVALTISC